MPATATHDRWFVRPRPQPQARLRLFCLPYAGGAASIFRTWSACLPPSIEVWPIQLPGRETRFHDPCLTRLDDLTAILVAVLRPHLTLPYAIFGHSMGALIGFALARRLRDEHVAQPQHLFASARRAPQIPRTDPPTYDLPEPAFLAELRRLDGTPEAVLQHDELRALMLPILRADFELNETYRYRPAPPLACPISAFGGLADPTLTRADLDLWREQTSASFRLRMVAGNHFFLQSAQAALLQAIAQDLVPALATT
jgi:medium-chain acyl-[acyl-carrier-protein] hydrolase